MAEGHHLRPGGAVAPTDAGWPSRSARAASCEIWVADPAELLSHADRLERLLSATERDHVHRQRGDARRARAVLSRGLLRLLLAGYLDQNPVEIDVDRRCHSCGEPHGRPRVAITPGPHISVAHCTDLLVLALDTTGPVGVDVESLADWPGPPPPELVDLALTASERRRLAEVPAGQRPYAFLRSWTCKEAVLKRTGTGLETSLHDVEITSFDPAGQVGAHLFGPARAAVRVRLLPLHAGHVGAVATGTATSAPVMRRATSSLVTYRLGTW